MEEFSNTPTNSDELLDSGDKTTINPLHEESQILQQQDAPASAPNVYQPATNGVHEDMESTGVSQQLSPAKQAANKRAAEILAMHKAAHANFTKARVIAIIAASLAVLLGLGFILFSR